MKKKIVAFVLVFALALSLGIGGTVAWLTATTTSVVNTFTVGDIDITLNETTGTAYDFVPGDKIAKDPKVAVTESSEACYLFVHVTDANNSITDANNNNKIINWTVDTGIWTPVTGQDGFWYKVVEKGQGKDGFAVFTDGITDDQEVGSITVSTEVTKGMVSNLKANPPTITVSAAAIQKDNITDVADAWSKLPSEFTGATY